MSRLVPAPVAVALGVVALKVANGFGSVPMIFGVPASWRYHLVPGTANAALKAANAASHEWPVSETVGAYAAVAETTRYHSACPKLEAATPVIAVHVPGVGAPKVLVARSATAKIRRSFK